MDVWFTGHGVPCGCGRRPCRIQCHQGELAAYANTRAQTTGRQILCPLDANCIACLPYSATDLASCHSDMQVADINPWAQFTPYADIQAKVGDTVAFKWGGYHGVAQLTA